MCNNYLFILLITLGSVKRKMLITGTLRQWLLIYYNPVSIIGTYKIDVPALLKYVETYFGCVIKDFLTPLHEKNNKYISKKWTNIVGYTES